MRIRPVVDTDRSSVFALLHKIRLFSEEETSCAMELLDIYLSDAHQRDYDFFCCADDRDTIHGFVCYGKVPLTDAVYDLYWIAVDAGTQNRGVGRVLLAHLDNLLMSKSARMVLAETSSRISYGKTRAFYAKNGYVEISRIPDFYSDNDDKIVFAKFYSLYERRAKQRWSTLIEGPTDLGEMSQTNSGMIGTGRFETVSER